MENENNETNEVEAISATDSATTDSTTDTVETTDTTVEESVGNTRLESEIYQIEEKDVRNVDVYLPSAKQSEIINRRLQFPEDIEDCNSFDEAAYAAVLDESVKVRSNGNIFHKAVEENQEGWSQAIDSDSGKLGAFKPKFKDSNLKVTGEKALLRVRTLLGNGGQITIPLWHSGFWVSFNTPSEDSILEFHNRLSRDKVSLGRSLLGASLANESVYTAKAIIDFATEHLNDTNLTTGKVDWVDHVTSALDLQHIAWGLACSIYQNGFDFARAIIDDDPNNTNIVTGKINVTKLQHTYRPALTDKQIRHMTARLTRRVSKEALEVYRNEFTKGQNKEVELSDNLKMTLKVPSLVEHIDSGYAWIESITAMIDNSYNISNANNERDDFITRQSKASQMRQFDHWVESISVKHPDSGNWERYERDEEYTIELLLNDFSGNDDIRKKFLDSIREYMNDSVVSIIAVTTASELEDKLVVPRFTKLFPIDAVAVFILLLIRRARLVEGRSSL